MNVNKLATINLFLPLYCHKIICSGNGCNFYTEIKKRKRGIFAKGFNYTLETNGSFIIRPRIALQKDINIWEKHILYLKL